MMECNVLQQMYITRRIINSWNTETKKNYGGNLNWTGWQPDISKYNVTLWQSDFVYDGAEKRPMVLLKYGTKILEEEAYNVGL